MRDGYWDKDGHRITTPLFTSKCCTSWTQTWKYEIIVDASVQTIYKCINELNNLVTCSYFSVASIHTLKDKRCFPRTARLWGAAGLVCVRMSERFWLVQGLGQVFSIPPHPMTFIIEVFASVARRTSRQQHRATQTCDLYFRSKAYFKGTLYNLQFSSKKDQFK